MNGTSVTRAEEASKRSMVKVKRTGTKEKRGAKRVILESGKKRLVRGSLLFQDGEGGDWVAGKLGVGRIHKMEEGVWSVARKHVFTKEGYR